MTTFTRTSPTSGGSVPAAVTEIGGIVLDMVGLNGVRVVTQLAASTLFTGTFPSTVGTIGTAGGISAAVLGALGGGITEVAVRVTLEDGDSAPDDFDDGANTLLLNGVDIGNFSAVATERTSSDGLTLISSGTGFGDDILSTGWFYSNSATTLQALFTSLSTGQIVFAVSDVDSGDNFYDFKQGVDGGLIDVGSLPNTSPNAQDDIASGLANTTIITGNVLLNDTDLETTLTSASISGFTNSANGTVAYNGDGTFSYTPNSGFTGTDSFTYAVTDGSLTSIATVSITVKSPTPPPGGITNILGTSGDDAALNGGAGREYIFARAGNDVLNGGGGDDLLNGAQGDDMLTGGTGGDQFRIDGREIEGGSDTDTITDLNFGDGDFITLSEFAPGIFSGMAGGNPLQILSGGKSAILNSFADLVELDDASSAVSFTRLGSSETLVMTIVDGDGDVQNVRIDNAAAAFVAAGGILGIPGLPAAPPAGANVVPGTSGPDNLLGTVGADWIDGGAGADTIFARAGNDTLIGGEGNDFLNGAQDDDLLFGGADADQFRLDARDITGGSDTDTVLDLNFAEGDTMVLASFGAGTLQAMAGGNPLVIVGGGTGAIINSYEDFAELAAASAAVTAAQLGSTDTLVLSVTDTDGDILNIQLANSFAAYAAAGGLTAI